MQSIEELLCALKSSNLTELPKEIEERVQARIQECIMILTETSKNIQNKVTTDRKCSKCHTTNPKNFNRKKTECTQCMSKAGYEKIKIRLESGKERNIQARLDRKECSVCNLKVERTNAQMFDWDHKNPFEKCFAISKMNYKKDEIFFQEIAKCDLTCRNCHMMRTMSQFQSNEIPKRKSNVKDMLEI